MKTQLSVIASFLAGALIASIVWGWHFFHLQMEYAAISMTALHGRASAGKQVLEYLDNPQPEKAARIAFMASNMVSGFSVGVNGCDERWPYFHMKQRWASECERFQEFLRERNARLARDKNYEPNGPTTNSTSPATGSSR